MAEQHIEVVQAFPFSVEKLFAFLSDHENLTILFPLAIKRVRDGQDSVNGVGSTRRMSPPVGPAFEETVTKVVPNSLIEYTITKGSPLKNHYGVMKFYPYEGGSRLHYTIDFESKLPFTGPAIKLVLEAGLRKGLKKLAKRSI